MTVSRPHQNETINGGGIISKMLAAEGVKTVFGIPDSSLAQLCSALESEGIRLVSPTHDTNAVHMAGACARITGTLGVCIAGRGTGLANALSGIAVENAEGHRVLLISSAACETDASGDPKGVYRYLPQLDATRPITKWNGAVTAAERISDVMRSAFRISHTGRPGVVHVDVPERFMNSSCPWDPAWVRDPASYRSLDPVPPVPELLTKAADMLVRAKFPLIHAGTGVIHGQAHQELMELAELLEAPVSTSWGARSAMDERRNQSIPMIYLSPTSELRNKADVVLALGSRMGETDWWGKPPYWAPPSRQKLIQVDLDEAVFGFNKPVDLAVLADVKIFMKQLMKSLQKRRAEMNLEDRRHNTLELRKGCRARRSQLEKHLSDGSSPMASAHVPHICQDIFDDDAIAVIDGGNTSIWGLFFHQVKRPNTIVGTPKMAHLGAGVSQALGAQVADPTRQVYCIIGDGAMGFHQQEIETAVRYNLPVIYLVLCDKQWGMVKMNQLFTLRPIKTLLLKTLSPGECINTDIGETRFDQLAEAMGAFGQRVDDPKALGGAIQAARDSGRCSVIHIDVNPVKHMWAPNLKDFKDLHAEPAG
ncbi:MAG: thiamine pyrophosphate-binding protein [Deltaproteobacteria bacterium]|nr:thiamine pyrophosphate-binding protein [Deltaproteobacteria bacterium]